MSKYLQAFYKIVNIHQYAFHEIYKEQTKIIETALKALEIVKERPIVALVDYKYTYEEWLELVDERERDLFKNKEEYDLLKEVLES